MRKQFEYEEPQQCIKTTSAKHMIKFFGKSLYILCTLHVNKMKTSKIKISVDAAP